MSEFRPELKIESLRGQVDYWRGRYNESAARVAELEADREAVTEYEDCIYDADAYIARLERDNSDLEARVAALEAALKRIATSDRWEGLLAREALAAADPEETP